MRRWWRLRKASAIDFVVIGPDAPAVAGLGDDVRAAGFLCFGPSKAAAQLEGSKAFTKLICDEANVPTAAYGRFDSEAEALAYVRKQGAPIVIKADGLAAGKGVTVAMTLEEAEAAVRDCFSGAFGASGWTVVIEEFLEGEEASDLCALRRHRASSCCRARRTTSGSAMAIPAPIPAAWAPIHRRR